MLTNSIWQFATAGAIKFGRGCRHQLPGLLTRYRLQRPHAIPGPVLPIFALPTTAGTGSEVSHSAVLTDETQQIKVSTLSHWLRPTCAVVDPALTDSCPAVVTAHSGIDALVHAVEAFTNRDFRQLVDVDPQARAYEGSYPLTRLLAGEAIWLVGKHLVAAY